MKSRRSRRLRRLYKKRSLKNKPWTAEDNVNVYLNGGLGHSMILKLSKKKQLKVINDAIKSRFHDKKFLKIAKSDIRFLMRSMTKSRSRSRIRRRSRRFGNRTRPEPRPEPLSPRPEPLSPRPPREDLNAGLTPKQKRDFDNSVKRVSRSLKKPYTIFGRLQRFMRSKKNNDGLA